MTAEDLAIWQQYPEAAFTLVELPDIAEDGREQFHLGAFELPLPADARRALRRAPSAETRSAFVIGRADL